MRSKGYQGKYSLILLFVGIFAFWWGIAVLAQSNKTSTSSTQSAASSAALMYTPQTPSGPVELQTIKTPTSYTYSGLLALSTPCDQLGTGLATSGSGTVHVTVALTYMKQVSACKEAFDGSDELPFSASLSVPPGTKVVLDGLTINGVIVQTTSATTTK